MMQKYAVFGNPIAHSLSPQIHRHFAQQTGVQMEYGRVLAPVERFAELAAEFFRQGHGCNITVPCKLAAYEFADSLTSYAKAAGAVNTLLKCEDGSFLGDNTDGRGLILDLQRVGVELKDKRILICGAGGATQGILKPLSEQQPQGIVIVNRTLAKAQLLCEGYAGVVTAVDYGSLTGSFDIIINASSSSLEGAQLPLSTEQFEHCALAYDLMYARQQKTVFLSQAQHNGVTHCVDGLGMLVMQAALSFELWTGQKPNALATYHYILDNA